MGTISPRRRAAPTGKFCSAIGNDAFSAASPSGVVEVKATSCSALSSMRATIVDQPPSNWLELRAMPSNTGCTSDGEPAMTFRISAVAVCRSSASFVSRNIFAFWIAIAAWPAKDSTSAISRSVNRAHWRCAKVRTMKNAPTARSCMSIGATTTA